MLPRCLTLVLIFISSVFFTKAQDSQTSIPSSKKNSDIHYSSKQALALSGKQKESRSSDTSFCSCFVEPQIVPLSKSGNTRSYQGIPNASCSSIATAPSPGLNIDASAPYDTCGVASVSYSWSITSGNSIATINGNNNGSTVDVMVSGAGSYVLSLTNTVVCSNGSSCSNSTTYTDTVQSEPVHCTCTAGPVSIQPVNKQGNLWTYSGTVQGNCSGQYGTPPNTSSCQVQNTTYQWSIDAPGGVASISGPTNGQTVNVSITGTGPFTLRLDGTTTCNDDQQCKNYNFYFDSAQANTPQSCSCNVQGATIQPTNKTDEVFSYQVNVNAQCTGQYGTSPDLLPCNVQNITYNWFISAGAGVAEIMGNPNGQSVTVRIKAPGQFTLDVSGDVTCSDGKKCDYLTYIDDSSNRKDKTCDINFEEKVEPKMDGGLQPKYVVSKKIERDGYIVLGADGRDYDQVKFTCTPSSNCNEKGSDKTILLNSRVRFEWVLTGEGSFVKLGGLPKDTRKAEGDHVIFQPPYVPLPVVNNDSTVTTTLKLTIIDDNPTQIIDPNVEKTITIVTKRFKTSPDEYTVTVQGPAYTPAVPTAVAGQAGDCNAVGPTWDQKTDLQKPDIELPDVTDKDKMVVGEWIVLNAKDQRDNDQIKMKCVSNNCDGSEQKKIYEDNIAWEWTLVPGNNNGRFVSDPKGRFVVYEAPDKLPNNKDVIEVKIRVKVQNADALKAVDVVPPQGEITLKIYRAGIKLDYPPLDWLPKENEPVDVRSYLVYKDGGEWKAGLAHQFRIHFFELLKVSNEKGVCMNEPIPADANNCPDLFFRNSKNHEAYGDKKVDKCDANESARTARPEREYKVTVRSDDFGAYGFMRAEASRNKKPEYESIPIQQGEFPHPTRPVTKTVYKDNRINIPRDIDENQIADNGWDAEGGAHIPDPADNAADADNTPDGDHFNGDGLSAYEEYRGFRVTLNNVITHIRTNTIIKDLFVHNPDHLPLNLFREQSGLSVHEIIAAQYEANNRRIVNFNAVKNSKTHLVDQHGLFLFDGGRHASLLGIAHGDNNQPAPPNWVRDVIVYQQSIQAYSISHNLNFNAKLLQITAHELGHACNVYHHGEGDIDRPESVNQVHGLRSGNMDCIMRYDNVPVLNPPEKVGNIFCQNATGTGTNAGNQGFGDANAALCRGNCIHQFRVSGKEFPYPKRTEHNCKKP
jgi:hypothetical protein